MGLSSGDDFLRNAAKGFFDGIYQKPPMVVGGEIVPELKWQPSLHFRVNDHLTVIAEVSETPYPMVFHLRRVDIEQLPIPLSIYCVCPEEAYLTKQEDAK